MKVAISQTDICTWNENFLSKVTEISHIAYCNNKVALALNLHKSKCLSRSENWNSLLGSKPRLHRAPQCGVSQIRPVFTLNLGRGEEHSSPFFLPHSMEYCNFSLSLFTDASSESEASVWIRFQHFPEIHLPILPCCVSPDGAAGAFPPRSAGRLARGSDPINYWRHKLRDSKRRF